MKFSLRRFSILALLIWCACALSSLSLGSATWDELLDFEGALGSLWHGFNTLKGLSPDLETITFNLEWFGNATRWPTFIPWLVVQPFDFNQIKVLDRAELAILTNYFALNHVNSILFGAAGLWLQYRILKKYSSTRVAWIGLILLLLYPAWSGNAWMNSKDVPFAFAYLLYSYSSASIFNQRPFLLHGHIKDNNSMWLVRVLAITLMVGSRLPSIVFVLLTEIVLLAREISRIPGSMLRMSNILRSQMLIQFLSLLMGLSLAFVATPQSWGNPIKYAIDCINYFSTETYYVGQANGFLEASAAIQRMIVTSTPSVILLGIVFFFLSLLIAFLRVVRFGKAKGNNHDDRIPHLRDRMVLPLSFWLQLVLPLALISLKGNASFQLRHILFCVPILCSISAIGIERACYGGIKLSRVISRPPTAFFAGVLALEFLLLNPYQYLYVGELFRIDSAFSSAPSLNDYWGFSLRESLSSLLKQGNGEYPEKFRIHLPSGYNPQLFWAYFNLVVPSSDSVAGVTGLPGDKAYIHPREHGIKLQGEYCTERFVLFPRPRRVLFGCITKK